ncbi:hypothetical protein [Microcoleus sp. PH2017_02_FOX_O_A]|nr:hypothetical protein [Microcoleus sp. PH2017_02_FOX_O_A]
MSQISSLKSTLEVGSMEFLVDKIYWELLMADVLIAIARIVPDYV